MGFPDGAKGHFTRHVGCYGLKSLFTFAFTAASILMSGGQGRLKPSPGSFITSLQAETVAHGVLDLFQHRAGNLSGGKAGKTAGGE